MKACIYGAGSLGTVLGAYITKNGGEIDLINRNKAHVEALNKNGAKIYWADGDLFSMKNAEVENEIKIAGKIKIVPVSTSDNVGVGFVAIG